MKKIIGIIIALNFLSLAMAFGASIASAQLRVLTVPQGGTGASTLTGCLSGNGTGAITGSGSACAGSSFSWPFTKQAGGEQATSTTLLFSNGFISTASSTANIVKLINLTGNGLVRTSGGDGTLSVDTTNFATFAWPFTKQAGGEQSTTTVLGLYNGYLSLASSTVNSSFLVTGSSTLQTTSLTAIRNLSSNGFVKTSGGDGTLSVDTNTYLTGMTFAWPFTKQESGAQATSTVMQFLGGLLSASSTITTLTMTGALNVGATSDIAWAGRSQIRSSANGLITLLNAAADDFSRLMFGGTSSAYPALKRSGTALQFRLADDSAFADTEIRNATTTNLNVGANHITFGSSHINASTTQQMRLASTSPSDIAGRYLSTSATTTYTFAGFPENRRLLSFRCQTVGSVVGGALVMIGDGTNFTPFGFCDGNIRQIVPGSNNTWVPGEPVVYKLQGASTTADLVLITPSWSKTSN